MKRPQIIRFAAFVTVLAVLLGYVVYHRTSPDTAVSLNGPTLSSRARKTNARTRGVALRLALPPPRRAAIPRRLPPAGGSPPPIR